MIFSDTFVNVLTFENTKIANNVTTSYLLMIYYLLIKGLYYIRFFYACQIMQDGSPDNTEAFFDLLHASETPGIKVACYL